MNKFTKSHWVADQNRVSLAMPISKVDKENRLVSGFATLDNVDTSDDVVTAEASKAAFAAFRGNIREMHQPIAAGRLVDFKEEEFFHDGEFFRGIYATAYVSKGAEDTWQKVLDGTLSGFSIGGNITEQETKFVKDAGENGKSIRYIEKYDLIELSLVDNPANQLANVFSIVKNQAGDTVMKGMVMDTTVINVFWCDDDEIAKNSTQESESCLSCGNKMTQIGWFEQGENDAVKTAAAVADFLRTREAVTTDTSEGGVNMTDEIKKDADVVTSGDVTNPSDGNVAEQGNTKAETARELEAENKEVPTEQEVDAKVEEKEEESEKTADAPTEPNFEKMFDDLKGSVNESIEKSNEKVAEAVQAVEKQVEAVTESFEKKVAALEENLSEISKSFEQVKSERENVAKRIDALEKATAIKKSGEVESEPEKKLQKGLWAGTFFDTTE